MRDSAVRRFDSVISAAAAAAAATKTTNWQHVGTTVSGVFPYLLVLLLEVSRRLSSRHAPLSVLVTD